ncbi:MAG TPA: hypothetical protein VGM05_13070 [Planctomycetaceae bacterium]|jgi:hypothetical protein
MLANSPSWPIYGLGLEEYTVDIDKEIRLYEAVLRILERRERESQDDQQRFQIELAFRLHEMLAAQPDQQDAVEEAASTLGFRRGANRLTTINLQNRTVDATVATETPVDMPDFKRREVVPEILAAAGAVLPESRQVPLLDAHKRKTTDDQLGSVRNLRIEGTEVVGTLHLASVSVREWQAIVDGHSTDVSAGYLVEAKSYIPPGGQLTFAGRTYRGPANLVTRWSLKEVSLVPVGADSFAKLRELFEGFAQ